MERRSRLPYSLPVYFLIIFFVLRPSPTPPFAGREESSPLDKGEPEGVVWSSFINKPSSISSRAAKYFFKAARAFSEINTTRIFPPLPRTEISSELVMISRGREQSSATRRPVEKRSSKIALSRRVLTSFPAGAFKRRSSSIGVMRSRECSPTLASSIRSEENTSELQSH